MKQWERIDAELKAHGIRIAPPTPCSTDGPRKQCPTHAPTSEHYDGRARDYGDKGSDCRAIAAHLTPYAKGPKHVIDELFYTPTSTFYADGVAFVPGNDDKGRKLRNGHRDHVHAGKVRNRDFPPPPQEDGVFAGFALIWSNKLNRTAAVAVKPNGDVFCDPQDAWNGAPNTGKTAKDWKGHTAAGVRDSTNPQYDYEVVATNGDWFGCPEI